MAKKNLQRSQPPLLFISHDARDRQLALLLKQTLQAGFSARKIRVEVFCSADIGDIRGGKEWFDEVMDHLRNADACVTLMTPLAIRNSWVLCETGGAYVHFRANRPGV